MLDQPVRLGLLARHQRRHVALARERELRLLGLDLERALRLARRLQRVGGAPRRRQRRRPRLLRPRAAGEDLVDLGIGEPLVGADHRAVERDPPPLRSLELHLDRDREPVLVRHQRARLVGQRLRQHRLDQAGHVDRRAAPVRLALDVRAGLDVGRDVGDVHPHPHGAVVEQLGGDRVVEVARRRRVDRERGQRPQVEPRRRRARARRPRAPRARPADRTGAAARGRASAPRARRAPTSGRPIRRTTWPCPPPRPCGSTSTRSPGRARSARERSMLIRRPRAKNGVAARKRPCFSSTATTGPERVRSSASGVTAPRAARPAALRRAASSGCPWPRRRA